MQVSPLRGKPGSGTQLLPEVLGRARYGWPTADGSVAERSVGKGSAGGPYTLVALVIGASVVAAHGAGSLRRHLDGPVMASQRRPVSGRI